MLRAGQESGRFLKKAPQKLLLLGAWAVSPTKSKLTKFFLLLFLFTKKKCFSMKQPVKERIGLYPGTFDPITNGHIDIIGRAARLVDRLIVGVAKNAGKGPIFTLEERAELVRAEIAPIAAKSGATIEVRSFETLLITFAQEIGASIIVRGLRAVSDFRL